MNDKQMVKFDIYLTLLTKCIHPFHKQSMFQVENIHREDDGTGEVRDNIPIDIEDGRVELDEERHIKHLL